MANHCSNATTAVRISAMCVALIIVTPEFGVGSVYAGAGVFAAA
jgi:hypothetical protein